MKMCDFEMKFWSYWQHEGTDKLHYFFYLQESFARAKNWVKELQRQASPNIVIALSGNKADLANKRAVDFQVRPNKQTDSQSYFFTGPWYF